MDIMGYIFLAGIIIVLATGGWVFYQDRKAANDKTSEGTK